MNSLNPPSLQSLKQPVVWNEDIYALGRDSEGDGNLYKYSLSSNEWSSFSVPSLIYASYSVLTTYCSKLLLINGENMTLWEFSNNDFAFKESCIKPIPGRCYLFDILVTSSDKYLIIASLRVELLIYNGSDWKRRHLFKRVSPRYGVYRNMAAIDSHAVFMIKSSDWDNDVGILRAPIPSFDEDTVDPLPMWEHLEMMSLEGFDTLLRGRRYSMTIQNQQFYCVDSKGIIFTAFIRPPLLPIVWGNSGVTFHQATHLVGLPDGALLMIGTTRYQDESQLDVIKVSHNDKGNQDATSYICIDYITR
jgi:hypothetical protein